MGCVPPITARSLGLPRSSRDAKAMTQTRQRIAAKTCRLAASSLGLLGSSDGSVTHQGSTAGLKDTFYLEPGSSHCASSSCRWQPHCHHHQPQGPIPNRLAPAIPPETYAPQQNPNLPPSTTDAPQRATSHATPDRLLKVRQTRQFHTLHSHVNRTPTPHMTCRTAGAGSVTPQTSMVLLCEFN
jgi:hypothetical protein